MTWSKLPQGMEKRVDTRKNIGRGGNRDGTRA